MSKADHKEEVLMELSHEAVPGYRKIFLIIFGLGCLYLGAIFLFGDFFKSLWGAGPGGH